MEIMGTRRLGAMRRPVASVSVLAMALTLLAACAPDADTAAPTDSESFWGPLRIDAREAEVYSTLKDLKTAADSVVVGTLGEFSVGRRIQGDAAEDVVTFVTSEVAIERTLAGRDLGSSVPLEFLGPAQPTDAEAMVSQLNAALPSGEVLMFLRDKGGEEAGLFRVVNWSGLWAETERASVDTPMTFEPPSDSTSRFWEEVRGFESLDALIEYISSL